MGNFRSNSRGGFGGGRGRGGFGGGRDRDGGRGGFGGRNRERRPLTMYDATCTKCGKECQVPFKPTGSKPVLCSDCFRQTDAGAERSFGGRGRDSPRSFVSSNAPGGMSQDQFKQLNAKLDRILHVLEELEIDVEEDELDEALEDELDEDIEDKEDPKYNEEESEKDL